MARPIKRYRLKINGEQIQVYKEGSYVGSISFNELCHNVLAAANKGTTIVMARPNHKKEVLALRGCGTKTTNPEERLD